MQNSISSPSKLYLRLLEENSPAGFSLSEQQRNQCKTRLLETIAGIALMAKKAITTSSSDVFNDNAINTAEEIFKILSGKEFSYLSKKESARHRPTLISCLSRQIKKGQRIPFYFDLGGGYGANINPNLDAGLRFTPGLSEIMTLYQIARFATQVSKVYPPGICFIIIIDNEIARAVNGIGLDKTLSYCVKLQSLINLLGMNELAKLYIQSNHWAWTKRPPSQHTLQNDLDEVLNYSEGNRYFDNNKPDFEQIKKHIDYYMEVSRAWDKTINSLIKDQVHLLQKSSKLPVFRSFPGSETRIQCGEVSVIMHDNKLNYRLVTTKNYNHYQHYLIAVTYDEIIGYIEEHSFRESYISYQIDFSHHLTGTYLN